MTTVYIGQIEIFSFPFAPKGWAQCNGQLLPINNFQALFALLGTTYGGNGVTNFALPDLRGRTSLGVGPDYSPGQVGGEEMHVLQPLEMPVHNHTLMADSTTVATSNGATPTANTVLGNTAGLET